MPSLFTFRGYSKPDPLDKAPIAMQYILMMTVTLAASVVLVYAITDVFKLLQFRSFSIKVFEVVVFTLVAAPLITLMRKSASWVLMLMIFVPLFLFDLYLQANFRDFRSLYSLALWNYLPGTFIDDVKILPLRFLMTLSFDALIFGPVCLWITRLIAKLFYGKKQTEIIPDEAVHKSLFTDEWSLESIDKPKRDAGFYILRILGFSYAAYLIILFIGMIGATPWPESIGNLISMTYANPALAINTYSKIGIMILFTFIGAYNIHVRYYCCWGLIVGHLVSTICSLVFYFGFANEKIIHEFLLTSAVVDGVMILMFIYILIKSKKYAIEFNPDRDFTKFFSTPSQLAKIVYILIAVSSILLAVVALYFRIFKDGKSGLGAVYGYPDPTLGNALTLYFTVAFIAILLAVSEKLRQYFFGVLLFPFFVGIVMTIVLFIYKDLLSAVNFITRDGGTVHADWYFMFFILVNVIVYAVMISLRKMSFNVDYIISSMSPSGAKNIMALASAFFNADPKRQSSILISIDQYIGGIRGRKRGLLNFPFWLVENVLNFTFAMHPNFSSMSRDEQRWFIKKYLLRDQIEVRKAIIPQLADFASQIGLAVNAMIMFAYYSDINSRKEIGYVPYYSRDRLQGKTPLFEPPYKKIAELPSDQDDPLNNEPVTPAPEKPFVAPRVTTNVCEYDIPDEMDYVILGSGAGGAVMSYRLACGTVDPSKILMLERGTRYEPLQDFSDHEMDMMKKLYKEGGLQQTKKFTMSVLQGECVGGTTVINNAICIKMTDETKSRWQNEYDIDLSRLEEEYKKIENEIEIKEIGENGINRNVKSKFIKAVEGYNQNSGEHLTPVFPLKANYRNIQGDENWNLGNKRQTKRTMLETYIPWSESKNVNVISNTTGLKFIANKGKAEYVILRLDNGDLKKVKINKALIVSGGVISSSHFLMRSGVEKNVGRSMSCNFAFPVTAMFDDVIDAFDGNQITLGAMDPSNRAVFETYFNPPAAFALASIPFHFGRREELMKNYKKLFNFGALVGSEPNGIIDKKTDLLNGQAFSWELGKTDKENIKYALTTILKLAYHAGAVKAVLPTKPGIEIMLTQDNISRFEKRLNNYPMRMEDLLMGTAHPQGGNILCGDRSGHKDKRVLNADFCVEGYSNIYVADASVFPESLGLNPQWTIMAMSSMAAERILNKQN
ncbi:MAG: GMC family oxidoreductase N-terminal domain-containing protein [bacterium]